jgi:hypothetical protein
LHAAILVIVEVPLEGSREHRRLDESHPDFNYTPMA